MGPPEGPHAPVGRPWRRCLGRRCPTSRSRSPISRAWASDLILDTGAWSCIRSPSRRIRRRSVRRRAECWFVVPEGNGKTTTRGRLALYHCRVPPVRGRSGRRVVPRAGRDPVPAGRGLRAALEMLHSSVHSSFQAAKGKRKTDVPRFTCLEGYRRINHHTGGRIQVFAADDRTGDGIIPTLGIIDEPHRLPGPVAVPDVVGQAREAGRPDRRHLDCRRARVRFRDHPRAHP